MSNLFISHSSRDNDAVKELQARLEEQGHRSVFLDLDPQAGIQAGVSWERTDQARIGGAPQFAIPFRSALS